MRIRALIILIGTFAVTLLAFQNCSSNISWTKSEQANMSSGGNGGGYNGKLVYIKNVEEGLCPDQLSKIDMRIDVRLNKAPFPDAAFIVRENCQEIMPKVLDLGRQAVVSPALDLLSFNGQSFSRDPSLENPVVTKNHLYVATTGSDSNPGTKEAPFRTIQHGVDSTSPGTVLHVAPGVYVETVNHTKSGTESAPIDIVSDVLWGAQIRPFGATGNLVASSGHYVNIIGFEVDGSNSPNSRSGIAFHGNHSSVQRNLVHHIAMMTACDPQAAAGIVAIGGFFSEVDEHIISNQVHTVGHDACNKFDGLNHQTTGSVLNNIVAKVSNSGLLTWHDAHHIVIANNTVVSSGSGFSIGSGDYYQSPAPADYITVINNIAYQNNGSGISEAGATGLNNEYSNNLVFGNGSGIVLQNGLKDSNTITTDPQFANTALGAFGAFKLQATSPAINAGRVKDAPAVDFSGISRTIGGAPDIGAQEWSP